MPALPGKPCRLATWGEGYPQGNLFLKQVSRDCQRTGYRDLPLLPEAPMTGRSEPPRRQPESRGLPPRRPGVRGKGQRPHPALTLATRADDGSLGSPPSEPTSTPGSQREVEACRKHPDREERRWQTFQTMAQSERRTLSDRRPLLPTTCRRTPLPSGSPPTASQETMPR